MFRQERPSRRGMEDATWVGEYVLRQHDYKYFVLAMSLSAQGAIAVNLAVKPLPVTPTTYTDPYRPIALGSTQRPVTSPSSPYPRPTDKDATLATVATYTINPPSSAPATSPHPKSRAWRPHAISRARDKPLSLINCAIPCVCGAASVHCTGHHLLYPHSSPQFPQSLRKPPAIFGLNHITNLSAFHRAIRKGVAMM